MSRRSVLPAVMTALALVLAACTSTVKTSGVPVFTPTASSPAAQTAPPPADPAAATVAPLKAPGVPRVTGTIRGHCHFRGAPPYQLPDPRCTPGSYDPAVTAARICAPGHSDRAWRAPSRGQYGTTRFKYDVAYPAYGVPRETRTELDHLDPVWAGGNNAAANLWPESPPTPNPKDKIEAILRTWVCDGPSASERQGRLESVRKVLATDWITALQVLGVGGP